MMLSVSWGLAGTVDYSTHSRPPQYGCLRVVGLHAWRLASHQMSAPKRTRQKLHRFSNLASNVIKHHSHCILLINGSHSGQSLAKMGDINLCSWLVRCPRICWHVLNYCTSTVHNERTISVRSWTHLLEPKYWKGHLYWCQSHPW